MINMVGENKVAVMPLFEEPPAEGGAKPGDKSVVFVPLKSGA
jgi:hypothetical protein